ncbi:hypothetical protein HK099_000778 [Clydaea vesicula]|uniref:Uncharacterized protein n=1 Tax=Clydaea vesicula TaxID=447962 RepID=A0AAD5XZC4_9FUNG|nr:hypothetical protein HK099_000778 [Clydaea vesicula]
MSGVLGSLDRDLAAKQAAKYDPQREAEARTWIETVTGEKIGGNFHESLKNGQLLCK